MSIETNFGHQRPLESKTWLSESEVAEYIGVTERTVRNYVSRGHLKGNRVRGSRLKRYRRSDVDALMRPIPTVGGTA